MSVTATVTAVDDSVIEGGDETVVVTASHGGGAVGSATVTIQDNDTPTWSVRVVEGAASTVTVSVDKEFEVDQTITLAVGGTAASGDYSLSSSSLTLDAGDMSVTATVTAGRRDRGRHRQPRRRCGRLGDGHHDAGVVGDGGAGERR